MSARELLRAAKSQRSSSSTASSKHANAALKHGICRICNLHVPDGDNSDVWQQHIAESTHIIAVDALRERAAAAAKPSQQQSQQQNQNDDTTETVNGIVGISANNSSSSSYESSSSDEGSDVDELPADFFDTAPPSASTANSTTNASPHDDDDHHTTVQHINKKQRVDQPIASDDNTDEVIGFEDDAEADINGDADQQTSTRNFHLNDNDIEPMQPTERMTEAAKKAALELFESEIKATEAAEAAERQRMAAVLEDARQRDEEQEMMSMSDRVKQLRQRADAALAAKRKAASQRIQQ